MVTTLSSRSTPTASRSCRRFCGEGGSEVRGLDLEPTDTLLRLLSRELEELSNRLVALSSEASPELGDAIAAVVRDLDRLRWPSRS